MTVFSDCQKTFYVSREPQYAVKHLAQVAFGNKQPPRKRWKLEGIVGVGGGMMAVVDPEVRPLQNYRPNDEFTILRSGKGIFECEFTPAKIWLRIRDYK
jgi:hypothetical protein